MRSSLNLLLLSVPFISAAATNSTDAGTLGSSTTENGLTDGTSCKAMTVVFARGVSLPCFISHQLETNPSPQKTTEQGNVGTLTGPPFFAALADVVGTNNLAVQGVDYPASVQGFIAGGDADGSKLMAQLVGQAQSQCPKTKVVVSGYSQGGQLVHNAAKMLNGTTAAGISSGKNFLNFLSSPPRADICSSGYLRRPKQRDSRGWHPCCEDVGDLPYWRQHMPARR